MDHHAQADTGQELWAVLWKGARLNYYERHIGDYLKDTAHLSLLEHGVYTRLLDVYYTREGGIPAADAARLIGARSRDERSALTAVLAEFFVPTSGVHTQPRCDREILRYQEKQAKAKFAADSRWQRNADASGKHGTSGDATDMRTHPPSNANGMPHAGASQSPVSTPQSPDTSVREPHTLPDEYREALKSRPELDPDTVYRKYIGHYPEKKRSLTVWEGWVAREQAAPGAAITDPNSRASVEALGVSLGLGKWDEMKELFDAYKARVFAKKGLR